MEVLTSNELSNSAYRSHCVFGGVQDCAKDRGDEAENEMENGEDGIKCSLDGGEYQLKDRVDQVFEGGDD